MAPGIEVSLLRSKTMYGEMHIVAARIDPRRCDIRMRYVAERDGLSGSYAEKECPSPGVAINGSFFAEDGSPLGLLVVDGRQLQRHFPVHEWGTFQLRNGRPELVKSSAQLADGVTQALECKPRLVVHGVVQAVKRQKTAERSAVGMDRRGQVIFAATQQGVMTLEQWARCVQRFGCVDALNLDGGPSAQMMVRGEKKKILVNGSSRVPVFMIATPAEHRSH
ncbi:MAG TPA: phosphodiester glycosidase family protein [Armatimonadota bacterium]|nr:phosphodiester glycosidase family protein [Armatimonadota bacterium]